MGPVEPLTRAVKEPVTRAAATARAVSVKRMGEASLVAGFYPSAGRPYTISASGSKYLDV